MNALASTTEPVSAETLQHVLGTGDLSKLSVPQRVEYYRRTCETIGVNPLTRPFRFMSLNGQIVLYATRDLTDQLRQLHKVRINIVDKAIDGDLFVVTARATMPDGRQDEDVGAVTIGRLQGDARANAVMKALTKAKRRVTLSICGLGFSDESELETISGAQTFDADSEPPAPIRTISPAPLTIPEPQKMTIRSWLDSLEQECEAATTQEAANAILGRQRVMEADEKLPEAAAARLRGIRAATLSRLWPRVPAGEEDGEYTDAEAAKVMG